MDPDEGEELAHAGLIAVGEVIRLDVREEAGAVVATSLLRVEQELKGHVASGFLALVETAPAGTCPGARIWAPGQAVAVLDTPDAAGVIRPSPCTSTTRAAGHLEVLSAIGAKHPETAGTWAGAPAAPPHATPSPFPADTGSDAVLLRIGAARVAPDAAVHAGDGRAVTVDADVAEVQGERVRVLVDEGAYAVAVWVEAADLARRPTRAVVLGGTPLELTPGAPLIPDGDAWVHRASGVKARGTVPANALGVVWRPRPVRAVVGDVSLARDTVLTDDAGTVVAELWASGGDLSLRRTGERRTGEDGPELQVELGTPWLHGRGWVAADALTPGIGITGSGRGSGTGRLGGPTVRLLPGLELAATDADVTFARVTSPVDAPLLTRDGERVWVVVETSWGPMGAWAPCPEGAPACGP